MCELLNTIDACQVFFDIVSKYILFIFFKECVSHVTGQCFNASENIERSLKKEELPTRTCKVLLWVKDSLFLETENEAQRRSESLDPTQKS